MLVDNLVFLIEQTGLAVGDVRELQEVASFKKLAMQVGKGYKGCQWAMKNPPMLHIVQSANRTTGTVANLVLD